MCVQARYLAPEPSVDEKGGGKILLPHAQMFGYAESWWEESSHWLRTEVVSKWLMMDHRINQYFKKKTKFSFCSTSQEIITGRVHWSRYRVGAHGYTQGKMP